MSYSFTLKLSKPGAAPIAVFLSHEVIGLFDGGYEYLLGSAMLTSVKVRDWLCLIAWKF
jgi:hypothetical protein